MGAKLSRKPLDVFRRNGTSTRAVVDRIVATFDRATASDVERGVRWYGEDADALLAGLVAAGAPSLEHAATAVAHISPRTTWARNQAGAYALVTAGRDAAVDIVKMSAGVDRAVDSLASDAPLSTLNGPKTKRFAYNLLGNRSAVTVDVWAARVALGETFEDPELVLARAGVYEAIEHAYRLAARRRGVDPTTMQATTWIVVRGGRAD